MSFSHLVNVAHNFDIKCIPRIMYEYMIHFLELIYDTWSSLVDAALLSTKCHYVVFVTNKL